MSAQSISNSRELMLHSTEARSDRRLSRAKNGNHLEVGKPSAKACYANHTRLGRSAATETKLHTLSFGRYTEVKWNTLGILRSFRENCHYYAEFITILESVYLIYKKDINGLILSIYAGFCNKKLNCLCKYYY